jgi:hypothetical protein
MPFGEGKASICRVLLLVGFSYGENGTFSPPMDVTNQMQNGAMQHTSGNSNYSSGSGGDSPESLSPGTEQELTVCET